jgi:hypothetical protein
VEYASTARVPLRVRSTRSLVEYPAGVYPLGEGNTVASEMGPRACRRGLGASPPPPQTVVTVRRGGVADGLDGRWRDVMTVVSGRGAHVLLLEAATVMVMSLVVRVRALLLFFLKVVMLEEVLLVALSSFSLFTSPPTPTTRPCGACLTQNISKARAGDPDRLSRGERTNWGGNLPVAQRLFLLARHLEGARTITLCYSDRGCLFPFTRYRPPRDGRHVSLGALARGTCVR